jgi:FADH2 O2-dependent halogenase
VPKLRGRELTRRFEIAVVGSGFAGSLFAMIAHRLGRSVVLLDRGKHPRVVIGESSTPLTNLLWEELTAKYDLPRLKPLAKWGTWQRECREIACGLKRGFSFYSHDRSQPATTPPDREHQLLVAASPSDEIADTHWYRSDFDHFLVRQAEAMGIEYLDETELLRTGRTEDGMKLEGVRGDREVSISAKFVVDASGPRGFLHRALGLRELDFPNYPATQAVYAHFTGVDRLDQQTFGSNEAEPPYPIDAAAVHHVFEGGWVWVLQFNNGLTSAGIAAIDRVAAALNFADSSEAWTRLLRDIPALRLQFAKARAERPFTHIPRLSFRSARVAGPDWVLLPSAAGFVDPLLSTGFPLTLLGISRLAEIVESDWGSNHFSTKLQTYAEKTDAELLATASLIASLYANMNNFPVFSALSLLYFAAASYSETVRRLGKAHLAQSFLLCDHPRFGPASGGLFERARLLGGAQESTQKSISLIEEILRAIAPFNVAGLGNPNRRNWYPVDPDDLFDCAAKVEANREDISGLLQRCGFQRAQPV